MNLYAVLGRTPLNSSSPPMQAAAFEAAGMAAFYLRAAAQNAQQALRLCRTLGIQGANVTVPFKESMLPLIDKISEGARAVGAVNTLAFREGRIFGENTDIAGVYGALRELGFSRLSGRRALVLGTGGAARAALYALTSAGAHAEVAGRNIGKAKSLAEAFGTGSFFEISSEDTRRALQKTEIIISALSTRSRVIPREWLPKAGKAVLLDANYGNPSAILLDAGARGLQCADGRHWLLHQGAASFRFWTGRDADIPAMRSALEEDISLGKLRCRPPLGITLTGVSGSGKTTAARILAPKIGLTDQDIDLKAEAAAGSTIGQIFKIQGEEAFRKLESQVLRELSKQPGILALGGGTLLREENISAASCGRLVVWLAVTAETAAKRLLGDRSRPLLLPRSDPESPESSMTEAIAALMQKRAEGWSRAADVVIDASQSEEETADEIEQLWFSLEEENLRGKSQTEKRHSND